MSNETKGIRQLKAIPVTTGPDEMAQVDFTRQGKLYEPDQGSERKAWVFPSLPSLRWGCGDLDAFPLSTLPTEVRSRA